MSFGDDAMHSIFCSKHGLRIFLAGLASVSTLELATFDLALAADADDGAAKPASTIPNIYLDMRTTYATVPAGAISIGLGNTAINSIIQTLQELSQTANGPLLPANFASPASRSVSVDLPLTVDVSDRLSLYGGVTASTTQTDTSGWSSLAITSWNLGFEAELHRQEGGVFPTATLQTTVTRSVPDGPLATTSLNNVLEFSYALDEDETKGWLAGMQHTRIDVDTSLAWIGSSTIGYVGGYYQWPSNWKVTCRIGLQYFGGAQLLQRLSVDPFTQPIIRLDLDRMDDDDNRLFGVTAEIAWVPKPAYQLTLRTPLYLVRN
jgi:hypothetical protein